MLRSCCVAFINGGLTSSINKFEWTRKIFFFYADTDILTTSVDVLRLSPSPVSATTQKVADIKTTHSAVLKPMSGLEELESQGLFL